MPVRAMNLFFKKMFSTKKQVDRLKVFFYGNQYKVAYQVCQCVPLGSCVFISF